MSDIRLPIRQLVELCIRDRYWRTMFAFENWHSALEMKLYIKRYIHHIGGLPDFTALQMCIRDRHID